MTKLSIKENLSENTEKNQLLVLHTTIETPLYPYRRQLHDYTQNVHTEIDVGLTHTALLYHKLLVCG